MTTTKEDQIHAAFKLCDEATDWETYKACAESYEKKLALAYQSLQAAHGTLVTHHLAMDAKLSEANARNAMLVEAMKEAKRSFLGLQPDFGGPIAAQMGNAIKRIDKAITANSESVAAWDTEKPVKESLVKCLTCKAKNAGLCGQCFD